jgi:hypothetical protein
MPMGTMYYYKIGCPIKGCDYHFDIKTNHPNGRECNTKKRYVVRHLERIHNMTKKEAIKIMKEYDTEKQENMLDMRSRQKKELFSVLSMNVKGRKFDPKEFVGKLSADTKTGMLNHYENTTEYFDFQNNIIIK